MSRWVPSHEIPEGEGRCFEVDGSHVAVFNMEGSYYALEGCCPVAEEGRKFKSLQEVFDTCPNHDWQFDKQAGACHFKPRLVGELRSVPTQGRWWGMDTGDEEIEIPKPGS